MPWGTQMMTFFASEATLATGGGASNPLLPFQVHAGYVMFWALLSPCYYWREHGGMFHGPAVDMFFFWLSKFWRNNFSEDSKGHSCRMHALLPRMILCMECRTFAENTVYRVWHDLGSSEFPRNNLSKDSKGQSCRRHALLPRMIPCMECGIILFLADEHQCR